MRAMQTEEITCEQPQKIHAVPCTTDDALVPGVFERLDAAPH